MIYCYQVFYEQTYFVYIPYEYTTRCLGFYGMICDPKSPFSTLSTAAQNQLHCKTSAVNRVIYWPVSETD